MTSEREKEIYSLLKVLLREQFYFLITTQNTLSLQFKREFSRFPFKWRKMKPFVLRAIVTTFHSS